MDDVVVVSGLGKDFGPVTAVAAVDFTVRRQEIFGFLGPNGAGKTTTINMLATLLKPTRGRAELAGHDVVREPTAVRRADRHGLPGPVARQPPDGGRKPPVPRHDLRRPGAHRRPRMDQVLEIVGLTDRRKSRVQHVLRRHETAAGDRTRAAAPPEASCSSTSRPPGSTRRPRSAMWGHVRQLRDESASPSS